MCELPPNLTANRSPEPDTLPHPSSNRPTFVFEGNRKKRRRDKALARKLFRAPALQSQQVTHGKV